MNAAELIAELQKLDPNTLVLVESYEGGFSPIDSISGDGPVQQIEGRPDYCGRYTSVESADELVNSDRKGWAAIEDPVTLVGDPEPAVVLFREGG